MTSASPSDPLGQPIPPTGSPEGINSPTGHKKVGSENSAGMDSTAAAAAVTTAAATAATAANAATAAADGAVATIEAGAEHAIQWLSVPAMRYPDAYVWLVFFSSLDIILTWLIFQVGGSEVNPIADQIIVMWGWIGASLFKYALVTFAIITCEAVGRKRDKVGRRLGWTMVAIASFPVLWSLALLLTNPEAVATLGGG